MPTQRDLPREFVEMLRGGATENQLSDLCGEIDEVCGWPAVLETVIRTRRIFRTSAKETFLSLWAIFGGGIRTDVRDDLRLMKALRKLLPPYDGPDMILYRSETRDNWDRGTYGISWSAQRVLAKSVAKEGVPRILLRAKVPAKAIVAKLSLDRDRYNEDEYLVDRRFLTNDSVQLVGSY